MGTYDTVFGLDRRLDLSPAAADEEARNLNTSPNLILTGMMGTGKTTVGRAVAKRLGRPFVDMDQVIEARAGRSIADIFTYEGEAAFRAIEADLCRELAGRGGLVIATGGGTLVDGDNRRTLASSGLVICLTADVETILRRLDGLADRPLLETPDRRARVGALLEAREAAYAALPHHVDTTNLTAVQVAERVLALWQRLQFGNEV